jgi:hypothetical protein
MDIINSIYICFFFLSFHRKLHSHRNWRFIQVNVTSKEMNEERLRIQELMKPSDTVLDQSIATALWFAARGLGIFFFSSIEMKSLK